MANELVTLKELADQLGLERSNARKWLLQEGERLGLSPLRARSNSSRGQMALAWSADDAQTLLERRKGLGYQIDGAPRAAVESNGMGVFYLLRLAPDIAPGRVKVGWAGGIEQRLLDHRCAAPTCELVRTWPCRRVWEPAAIAAVAAVAARQLSAEAFDVGDVDATAARLDQLFRLMAPASAGEG